MRQYLDLLQDVLDNGIIRKEDVQGVGNKVVFARTMRFNLADGFPLMTTKKVNYQYVLTELLWFLTGESYPNYLEDHNNPIWRPWYSKEAFEKYNLCEEYGLKEGDLGRIYGPQWVRWLCRDGKEINQIQKLIDGLKNNPNSKRHKVIAWNPEDVDKVFVAPCHGDFKCCVLDGVLHLHMNQRSADVVIGIPYNIASYATLLLMLAQVTGLKPGELSITTEDTHIYLDNIEAAKKQLERSPLSLPTLKLNPNVEDIFKFEPGDFELIGYNHHSFIQAPVAV